MADPDVIVIGGGAAGLGAARRLAAAGVAVRVIEARSRLGGRAWTLSEQAGGGYPLDLGCGWLHSAEENELSTVAAELGFAVDKTLPPWARRRVEIGFPRAEQEDFQAAMGRLFSRLEEAGEEKTDQPADRCLEPGSRWNPLLNATSTYINGAELDRVSVHDFYNYHDTGVNWRVTAGYGTTRCVPHVPDCSRKETNASPALKQASLPITGRRFACATASATMRSVVA